MLTKIRLAKHHFSLMLLISLAALLTSCSDHDQSHDHSHGHSTVETTTISSSETVSHAEEKHDHDTEHDENPDQQESRSASQHTHGDAALAIVLEGTTVTIELDSPLFNLVGFEHQAETDVQLQAVAQAEARLVQSDSLFDFNTEAKCLSSEPLAPVHIGAQHEPESEHEEAHDDEHNEEHESEHSDVILTYKFNCANPAALTSATVKLFDYFEHMNEIDLVFLGPATQKQQTLSATNNRAILTR